MRLTDLREILRYVPQFRDRVFVIALDGAVVESENLGNVLLDVALLRSLRIGVVLVHGAGQQLQRLAAKADETPSDLDGTGVTDLPTLQLAITAAGAATQELLKGLADVDLRGAYGNAVVAHPAGILRGVDQQWTGRVERVDARMLRDLLERDIVPVIGPIGFDGEGNTYRVNSDAVAVDVARALAAAKLIFLTPHAGIHCSDRLLRQVTVEEAETLLQTQADRVPSWCRSKLTFTVQAARAGIPRVHVIDGRLEEGLLAEVFSNEGIGTLVYANEYEAIRPARRRDLGALFALIRGAVERDELLPRTRGEIARRLDDFLVFEVDGNPVACVALHLYRETSQAELACLCVDPRHENQGIGAKLVRFVESRAREAGAERLVCLSTQAVNYFVQKSGFRKGDVGDLPTPRREQRERDARNSQVLVKELVGPANG